MARADDEERNGPQHGSGSRIPTFTTIEEEAAFWDTHSIADFEDELEVVTDVRFVKPQADGSVTIRLEQASHEALLKQARADGIEPSALARRWVEERLDPIGGGA